MVEAKICKWIRILTKIQCSTLASVFGHSWHFEGECFASTPAIIWGEGTRHPRPLGSDGPELTRRDQEQDQEPASLKRDTGRAEYREGKRGIATTRSKAGIELNYQVMDYGNRTR